MRLLMASLLAGVAWWSAAQCAWAQDPTSACMAHLAGDASLQKLASRTPLASLKALTLPMLADTSKPDDADKLLLAQWSEQLKHCYSVGQAFRAQNVTAPSQAILDAQQHAVEALLARLYAGELSYGEFNRARQDTYDQFARQASASAQQMFNARAAQAQTAQQAALDAQRQAATAGSDQNGESGESMSGRPLLNSASYPAPASNPLDGLEPSQNETGGIAAAACAKAGLGANCANPVAGK